MKRHCGQVVVERIDFYPKKKVYSTKTGYFPPLSLITIHFTSLHHFHFTTHLCFKGPFPLLFQLSYAIKMLNCPLPGHQEYYHHPFSFQISTFMFSLPYHSLLNTRNFLKTSTNPAYCPSSNLSLTFSCVMSTKTLQWLPS